MSDGIRYRANVFNLAAPGANTAIVTAFSPEEFGVAFRVTVALTTASVFNVTCTDGTTTHKWGLGGSATLNAGDLYTFTFSAPKQDQSGNALSYSFEVETDSVIELLAVEEIDAEVV